MKRMASICIDFAIAIGVAFVYLGLTKIEISNFWLAELLDTVFALPIFAIVFFGDLVFRNASIGKKLMGFIVVDDKWKKPSVGKLFKRKLLMYSIGWLVFIKLGFNVKKLAIWEYDHVHTRVVEKKGYMELKKIAEQKDGAFDVNMEMLYRKKLGIHQKED